MTIQQTEAVKRVVTEIAGSKSAGMYMDWLKKSRSKEAIRQRKQCDQRQNHDMLNKFYRRYKLAESKKQVAC